MQPFYLLGLSFSNISFSFLRQLVLSLKIRTGHPSCRLFIMTFQMRYQFTYKGCSTWHFLHCWVSIGCPLLSIVGNSLTKEVNYLAKPQIFHVLSVKCCLKTCMSKYTLSHCIQNFYCHMRSGISHICS
jgi:hypothetical protein